MTLSFTTLLRWLAKDSIPYFYQIFISRMVYSTFLLWFISFLKRIFTKLHNILFYLYFSLYAIGIAVFIWEVIFVTDLW